MSFKIPCGGFKLDEKSFSLDENGVLSIPKPLTYDYMPEGYPSKSVGTVTLMEEQEVTFSKSGSNMRAQTPTLDIKLGDKLTIIWDGVSYNATVKRVNGGHSEVLAFGNLGLVNLGDAEDYPFVCGMLGSSMVWTTSDTATSHTISVKIVKEVITPMAEEFLPEDVIVNIVGEKSDASGNKYLLFDKTDEEIYNALNNGSTVKLNYYGYNLQYDLNHPMFWGVVPYTYGTNGITQLAVVSVGNSANSWYPKENYITASKTS